MRRFERNASGQLLWMDALGAHVVVPVRAFPLSDPSHGISLLDLHGHEQHWIAHLEALSLADQALLTAVLAEREFRPEIRRLITVSSYSTPSIWQIETDRGATSLVLKGEEDIRRLPDGRLLIGAANGMQFGVEDMNALDKASRRKLDRFL